MTPAQFIAKWRDNPLTEKAGAQAHFLDLCELLGVDKPGDAESYCFERGALRTGSGHGWADVWKKGCFGWENKAPGSDLSKALKQLMTYALALDNPPLLVVCDREIIQIHTHFTGTPSEVHTVRIEDIGLPENLQKLRWLFSEPERFRPAQTVYRITEEAAARMGEVAKRLAARGENPQQAAHFLIQCVFCMFAEDAGLLPQKLFETVLDKSNPDGTKAQARLAALFAAMQGGGDFGFETIPWFNGGLFKEISVPQLETADVVALLEAARMNWNAIEPAILGTLFERGLNPDMRSQLGAHYTDPDTIMKLIRPVIEAPLQAEWEAAKAAIAEAMGTYQQGGKGSQNALKEAQAAFIGHLERLKGYRALDPACGSGNFLYLALKTLKDLEHKANLEAETLGLQRQISIETGPANVLGIELNPYAAELARVTVWIGELQWMIGHGYPVSQNPILRALEHIEQRDAILQPPSPFGGGAGGGSEPGWPAVDAIVGNPPFLGGSKKRGELGDAYFDALDQVYKGRLPGGADLVTYWFEKARGQIEAGKCRRAGLVATNSIRGGANRKVLERIVASTRIFEAWSDEEWVNNGAAVRVSLVCFGQGKGAALNGNPVAAIHSDLTATPLNHTGGGMDLTLAKPLRENKGVAFIGGMKKGQFDVSGVQAREWLHSGGNPNGKPNSDVVLPWRNGLDVTRRFSDSWIVDFGLNMPELEASLYESPFQHVLKHVKPARDEVNNLLERSRWWLHARPAPELREATKDLPRFIATPRVAKYRLFDWLMPPVICDGQLVVIARSDDTTFGILHSRFHELWSLRMGTSLEDRPRYTPTTTFETFPFPAGFAPTPTPPPGVEGLCSPLPMGEGPGVGENIASAARKLDQLRENWLNPPEWVDWVRTKEEEQAGFPLRPTPKPGHEAELKKRTLTNLYNARPAWLDHAHRELDQAVAAAYGWEDYTPDMPDGEILKRLLSLNLARTGPCSD